MTASTQPNLILQIAALVRSDPRQVAASVGPTFAVLGTSTLAGAAVGMQVTGEPAQMLTFSAVAASCALLLATEVTQAVQERRAGAYRAGMLRRIFEGHPALIMGGLSGGALLAVTKGLQAVANAAANGSPTEMALAEQGTVDPTVMAVAVATAAVVGAAMGARVMPPAPKGHLHLPR